MTSVSLSANRQHTHSIMAGSVDNVDLLEFPIQEVSADGQDVTTTTVVLLTSHTLGQAGAIHHTSGDHTTYVRWRMIVEKTMNAYIVNITLFKVEMHKGMYTKQAS